MDPVVRTVKSRLRTFTWFSACSRRSTTKALRPSHAEAAEFGIRSGVSIPIRPKGRICRGS
ncbi:autoinducer binding domain-containing protein, partial [Acinetobacter baumannii]|uniref:autoinducer binding domain-containing protein n=1 Tax=Acinetobacter baumannii TaxID=470 RepID=UPI0034D3996B